MRTAAVSPHALPRLRTCVAGSASCSRTVCNPAQRSVQQLIGSDCCRVAQGRAQDQQCCSALPLSRSCRLGGERKRIPVPWHAAASTAEAEAAADAEAVWQRWQFLPEGERLANWVREHGGYVHEALALSNATDCGARGIVTREAIAGEDAQLPLVLVPEELYMTAAVADRLLSPALQRAGRPPLRDTLNAGLALAALLADQRQKRARAFFAPYIESLPLQPPCPWTLPPQQLDDAFQALGLDGQLEREWRAEVQQAAQHAQQQAQAAAAVLAPVHKLDPANIVWGMGQIASRAFGGFEDPGMAPFIDLMNHADQASHPLGVEDGSLPCDGVHYAVFSLWQGQPRNLKPGQELFISYQVLDHGMSPLNVFLNFGPAQQLMDTSFKVAAARRVADIPDGKMDWAFSTASACTGNE